MRRDKESIFGDDFISAGFEERSGYSRPPSRYSRRCKSPELIVLALRRNRMRKPFAKREFVFLGGHAFLAALEALLEEASSSHQSNSSSSQLEPSSVHQMVMIGNERRTCPARRARR